MASTSNSDTKDREVIINRLINAPRELVWEVWTNPEHVIHWWGPEGFTNTIQNMEVKPGGIWNFIMHGPDNMNFPNKITFNEVVKPERLSYTHGSDDPNDTHTFNTIVTFEEKGGKTNLTMRAIFATSEEREKAIKEYGAAEGGKQTFDRLEIYLVNQLSN